METSGGGLKVTFTDTLTKGPENGTLISSATGCATSYCNWENERSSGGNRMAIAANGHWKDFQSSFSLQGSIIEYSRKRLSRDSYHSGILCSRSLWTSLWR